MSAFAILVAKLTTNAGVTAFTTAARIYPLSAPQTVQGDYLLMNVVSSFDEQMLNGAGQYFRTRVAIECLSQKATRSYDLGTAVIDALRDTIKQTVAGCTDVDIVFANTDMTDYDDNRTMSRRVIHFRIRFRIPA